jgi:DNA polymerase-3 subunit delta'
VRISDVQHQPRAHRIIQRALASRRMPHAYLFAGPEGVGKEMMALGLAQTMLCASPVHGAGAEVLQEAEARGRAGEQKEGGQDARSPVGGRDAHPPEQYIDACGACQDCRLVEAGTHPDQFLIYRQLGKQHPDALVRKRLATQLGVDVIRHFLINQAGHRPSRGRAKVFIVREAERMSEEAQNALLKTLEEPPPDTFLILLAPGLDRMLPTTRSRCQHVLFSALPPGFVRGRLGALRPEADAAALAYAARHCGGSLGQALREIDDGVYAMKCAWGRRLAELATAGPSFAAHALAGPFEQDAKALAKLIADRDPDISDTDATRAGIRTLLAAMADFYLDATRRAQEADLPLVNADQPEVIDALLRTGGTDGPAGGLREIHNTESNLARNANIQLTLEGLFIRLTQAASRRS